MNLTLEPLLAKTHHYLPLLNRLKKLFGEMDMAYAAVADGYGFHCTGCADNCCLTRFYHHTLLEHLYLMQGVATLAPDIRQAVFKQARWVKEQMDDADCRAETSRIMCPLNQDARCILYPYRPMICRLHGIPHELHRPDGSGVKNPGCDLFFDQCRERGRDEYIRFDRTPFYRKMAMLENELRLKTGYTEKTKLTIAQMLTTITESVYEID